MKRNYICPTCKNEEHSDGAKFCRICGNPIEITTMKAITVWQPWASLLAIGAKQYETRSWATKYRGPIAIHAAALNPFKAIKPVPYNIADEMRRALKAKVILTESTDFRVLPLGCIIATAELVNCWHIVYHPGLNVDIAKHIPIGKVGIRLRKKDYKRRKEHRNPDHGSNEREPKPNGRRQIYRRRGFIRPGQFFT